MYITLDKLQLDKSATIQNIKESDLKNRLIDLGFNKGTKIKPVLKSPFNNPVAYKIKGSIIALRNDDAKTIEVEVQDEK